MILAIWHRYVTGSRWWLVVLAAVMLVDVFLGTWLLSKELQLLKEAWHE